MRLVSFDAGDGRPRAGAMIGSGDREGVLDLEARFGGLPVKALIADHLDRVGNFVAGAVTADYGRDQIRLDLPITDPAKIFCVGVNYMNRNAEYKDDTAAPEYPSLFMRTPLSFSPHGQAMLIPPESDKFDYEGEVVLVIGKPGRRIKRAEAHGHIAGLTIMNEGSVRDWLRHAKFNVTQGKNFDRSGGLGPWIQTDLSAIDLTDMTVETRVNGETRQKDTTANMAFPFDRIIEYISTFCTLLPGDLIATGTPTGAGARFDPPKWLVDGDIVEVEVEGVGTLVNPIRLERP